MGTKLYRSRTDRMIGGVCGGLGRYLGIDPIIVRLFFILLAIGKGIGVLIYFVLWILMPEEPVAALEGETLESESLEARLRTGTEAFAGRVRGMGSDLRRAVDNPNPQAGLIVGVALILLGVVFFLENLNFPWLRWLDFDVLWPLLLIVGGVVLLLRRVRGS